MTLQSNYWDKKVAEKNDADIIAGDFNSAAHCERGKAKVSSIKEVWEEMLLIPPHYVVPMWCQMKVSRDCCGFFLTQSGELKWRVARHGSYQPNKDRMQMKKTDRAAHLPVNIHLCAARAVERSARSEAVREYRRKEGLEKRRERGKRKGQTFEACGVPRGRSMAFLFT